MAQLKAARDTSDRQGYPVAVKPLRDGTKRAGTTSWLGETAGLSIAVMPGAALLAGTDGWPAASGI